MRKLLVSAVVVGTTVAALIACSSGGSGGGGAGAVSSVDSSKNLSSLSDSEAKQYCEDAQNYQKSAISEADRKKVNCGIGARILGSFSAKDDAEAQSKCRTQFDECMAKPAQTADAGASSSTCDSFKARLASCNVTVGEANQCVADEADAYRGLVGQDQCALAKAASPDGGFDSSQYFEEPASCKQLADRCPSLFSSTTSGSSNGG